MIRVRYYCPGCRKTMTRTVVRAWKFYPSYCETTQRVERLRKSRAHP